MAEFTEFDFPTISVGPAPKFPDLLERSERKKAEYMDRLAAKRLRLAAARANKQPLQEAPLTEEETQALSRWQEENAYNQLFDDSVRRNQDAWFQTHTLGGQIGNKLLGVGTGILTDIGLNIVKAPAALGTAMNRLRVSDEAYQRAKVIEDKQASNIELTPQETAWMNDGNSGEYAAAKQLLTGEKFIQSIDQTKDHIKSVVNTLHTDLAVNNLFSRTFVTMSQG